MPEKKSAALTFLLGKKKKRKDRKEKESDGISMRKAIISVLGANACLLME